jgi:hypothetical protein
MVKDLLSGFHTHKTACPVAHRSLRYCSWGPHRPQKIGYHVCERESVCLRNILRWFWVFAARQVFASELNYFALVLSLCCSTGVRVGAFGSESTLYMVYFIYGNGNIGGWNPLWRLLEEIWVVCDEDWIDYLVNFYSKSNRLSISIFTVIVIDLVAKP